MDNICSKQTAHIGLLLIHSEKKKTHGKSKDVA